MNYQFAGIKCWLASVKFFLCADDRDGSTAALQSVVPNSKVLTCLILITYPFKHSFIGPGETSPYMNLPHWPSASPALQKLLLLPLNSSFCRALLPTFPSRALHLLVILHFAINFNSSL